MGKVCNIIILYITISYLQGIESLQTLADLRTALQRNSLLLPHKPILPRIPSIPNVTEPQIETNEISIPCSCAVFLSDQFTKGSSDPPKGNPALLQEQEKVFPCTSMGLRQCQTKCLETIVKHLPNSAEILCATIGRDCHKERAYLFVKNCNSTWHNSNLSAGREYCCKDNLPYTCPLI